MSTLEKTKHLVEGRRFAEDTIALAVEDLEGSDPAFVAAFWRSIAIQAEKHVPPRRRPDVPARPRMSDEDAKRFECRRIKFGRYEGTRHAEVPIDYLVFVATAAEELQAYLRSDRGQRRQA